MTKKEFLTKLTKVLVDHAKLNEPETAHLLDGWQVESLEQALEVVQGVLDQNLKVKSDTEEIKELQEQLGRDIEELNLSLDEDPQLN